MMRLSTRFILDILFLPAAAFLVVAFRCAETAE